MKSDLTGGKAAYPFHYTAVCSANHPAVYTAAYSATPIGVDFFHF